MLGESDTMRIGQGQDFHPLVKGRKLMLGGVEVPYEYGLDGWSDADALLHAVIDALLGAAALGDIGSHFPSDDPQYKDVSSLLLLGRVGGMLREQSWQIANIDSTIVAASPRLHPYADRMQQRISQALDIMASQVSVKAKTSPGAPGGDGVAGISAYAVALLEKKRAKG